MRILALTLIGLVGITTHVSANKNSARDLGFVKAAQKPFRLVMFFDAGTAVQAKLAEGELTKDLLDTNIVLVPIAIEKRKEHPAYDQLPVPAKRTKPLYWLVAPDGRSAAVDPMAGKQALFQSPMRDTILSDVARSLCAVLLLESTDAAANDKARGLAETVVGQVNKVRTRLQRTPRGEVKLRTLTVAERNSERWLLWSLGEEPPPGNQPKLAVIFGNMRRSGPLLVGTAWPESDLFARIASLGQFCEADDAGDHFLAPPIVFLGSEDWYDRVSETLPFDPHDEAMKTKLKTILDYKATGPSTRKLSFAELMTLAPQQLDEMKNDPHKLEEEPIGNPPEEMPVETRPLVSSPQASTIILIVGVVGWIALGIATWILERRAELAA